MHACIPYILYVHACVRACMHAYIHTHARERRTTNDAGRHVCKRRCFSRRLALACTLAQNDTGTDTLTWIHTRHFLAAHLQKSMQLGWEPVFPIVPAALRMHTYTFTHTHTTSTNTWQRCTTPTRCLVCVRARAALGWQFFRVFARAARGRLLLPAPWGKHRRASWQPRARLPYSQRRQAPHGGGVQQAVAGPHRGCPQVPPPLSTSRPRDVCQTESRGIPPPSAPSEKQKEEVNFWRERS